MDSIIHARIWKVTEEMKLRDGMLYVPEFTGSMIQQHYHDSPEFGGHWNLEDILEIERKVHMQEVERG